MNKKVALGVLLFSALYPATAGAQAENRSDAKVEPKVSPEPKPYDCDPICRPGFVCANGQCVTPCNPPCPGDQVCAGFGKCVPAPVCEPLCRAGFVCLEGTCVSACNPPCGGGEVCAEGGQCVRPPQNNVTTVWIWDDRPPQRVWYWYTPRHHWQWGPRPLWHGSPPRHHPKHGDGPGRRRPHR